MKIDDITVKVKAKLDVDEGTANACLKLVEIFCNENNLIVARRDHSDGTHEYEFVVKEINYDSAN